MSGLDTMIQTIRGETEAEARSVLDEAQATAARLLDEARAETDGECEALIEQGRRKAAELRLRAETSAAMERRRAVLAKKQALLDQTVRAAKDAVLQLPEGEYFGFLIRLARENAEPGHGVMILSKRDLARCPSDFHVALNRALPDGATLDISENARPIEGGFILQYGDIEQNCSLSAIFDENREKILDAAHEALFR